MPEVSVIICTHNPRPDYLRRCVAALEAQTLPIDRWELIVIDNASAADQTPRPDLVWHRNASLLREDTLGLTPARLRGIREAKGDLIIFVDDDNVLEVDFLSVAQRIAQDKPFLGAWSGQCRPEFEQPPPDWAKRYFGNLVIREFDREIWSNLPRLAESMPCGAGLCLRRDVARHYLLLHDSGHRPMQLDRTGTSLMSGGDNDLAACACDINMGVGLLPQLKLTHLIPPERLTVDYLARLVEGVYFSAVVLAHLRQSEEELRSFAVRWHEAIRVRMTPDPHRRILAASLAGRRKGMEYIASLGRHA